VYVLYGYKHSKVRAAMLSGAAGKASPATTP